MKLKKLAATLFLLGALMMPMQASAFSIPVECTRGLGIGHGANTLACAWAIMVEFFGADWPD